MKTGVVVQARVDSTRLPGKCLMDIAGKPAIQHVLERSARIKGVDRVVLATTNRDIDHPLLDAASDIGFDAVAYEGDTDDVLSRYLYAAKVFEFDNIVRITGDCPLIDPEVSSVVVEKFLQSNYDYVTNRTPPTWPDGLDTEVFSFWCLYNTDKWATSDYDREHVTAYMYHKPSPYSIYNVDSPVDLSEYRWTLDNQHDLDYIRYVYSQLPDPTITKIMHLSKKRTQPRS